MAKQITVKEAAEMLNCSTAFVYSLRKRGVISDEETGGISQKKVTEYKRNRKIGRPIGSFKEVK